MRRNVATGILALTLAPILLAANVSALDDEILTLEAEQDSTSGQITYTGTTADGITAVSCALTASDGEEIDFRSVGVTTEENTKTFSGDFGVREIDSYTISCADYNGGTIKTVEITSNTEVVTPDTATTEEDKKDAPETGSFTGGKGLSEANMVLVITLSSIIVLSSIISLVIRQKKRKDIKE